MGIWHPQLRSFSMEESYHDKHGISQFLTDLAPKETPWIPTDLTPNQLQMLYEYSEEFNKYAERINGCSGILKNSALVKISWFWNKPFFCRVRFCPVCQWRRSLLWRAVMFQKLEEIKTQYPTHRWVFLTLTVRNCDLVDLRGHPQGHECLMEAYERNCGF